MCVRVYSVPHGQVCQYCTVFLEVQCLQCMLCVLCARFVLHSTRLQRDVIKSLSLYQFPNKSKLCSLLANTSLRSTSMQ